MKRRLLTYSGYDVQARSDSPGSLRLTNNKRLTQDGFVFEGDNVLGTCPRQKSQLGLGL